MEDFFKAGQLYNDNSNAGTITYNDKRNNYYQPGSPYYLKVEEFTDLEEVVGVSLQIKGGTLASKKILGITKAENDTLELIIVQNHLNNPKIYFKSNLSNENDFFISNEKIKYWRYSLMILGEDQEGNLKLIKPLDLISVITIDHLVYTSISYSKYIKSVQGVLFSNFNL